MTYVKINGAQYPATISGKMVDKEWDNRASKSIHLEMTHEDAVSIWIDGASWSIISENFRVDYQYDEEGNVIFDEEGNPVMVEEVVTEEYDNSDYHVAGDITNHRDGTVTVKMGKLTELEELQAQIANSITEAELDAAYMEGVNSI